MSAFFDNVILFFHNLLNFLTGFKDFIFNGLLFVVREITYFGLEIFRYLFLGLETVIIGFFQTLDLSAVLTTSALDWSGVPPQLSYVVVQCSIPQGLTLIAGAYAIRLSLNLIPAVFTRV